jgi:hypothetical protein
METDVIYYYYQGALTGEDLQSAIDEELANLVAEDGELGVRFEVVQPGGFVGEDIIIQIAVNAGGTAGGAVGLGAAKAIWGKVLKRVKAARGDDAIGPEAPAADPEAES